MAKIQLTEKGISMLFSKFKVFCSIAFAYYSVLLLLTMSFGILHLTVAHEAKDFDDTILYKIDFEMPDFDKNLELKNHIRTFYTHEKEKYDCAIPTVEDIKEEKKTNEPELSPFALLQPTFDAPSCSYRIEAYWSYEICHGDFIRQYHEEREGKTIKFQEYYLGKWSAEKVEKSKKIWEEERKAGIKYKTTKIDNTKYPYFEVEMTDGTMCDIINAPRTTYVRYVCYPHGKNEIYSFKETSSCNYEAIILTSALCMIPAFLPEQSKEVPIQCSNSLTKSHKPLSMLRQELSEMQVSDDDFPESKEASAIAAALARTAVAGDRILSLNKFTGDVDKLVLELMAATGLEVDTTVQTDTTENIVSVSSTSSISDVAALREFISGKNCLTGGGGWWRHEFCYGRHVRQFHKDKQSETELFLGFFSENSHRQWSISNPDKGAKRQGFSASLWHHYERGTRCDRTGLPREVDVKLTCTPITNSAAAVSMYLLEPKTCQYILVVESPIICDLIKFADEHGLVHEDKLDKITEVHTTSLGPDAMERDEKSARTTKIESIETRKPTIHDTLSHDVMRA